MRRTFSVTKRTSRPAASMENFRAAWCRFIHSLIARATVARPRPKAEARPIIAEKFVAEQDQDHAIATIRAIYGQDFGSRRLAREISRNRSR